jgi:hypothetical protein
VFQSLIAALSSKQLPNVQLSLRSIKHHFVNLVSECSGVTLPYVFKLGSTENRFTISRASEGGIVLQMCTSVTVASPMLLAVLS